MRGAWRGAKVPLKYPLVALSLFMSSNKIIVCEEAQASQILSEESTVGEENKNYDFELPPKSHKYKYSLIYLRGCNSQLSLS